MKEWRQHNMDGSNRSGQSSKLSDSDFRYLKMLPETDLAEISRDSGLC
jgi:hypothetical protein